MAYDEVVKIEAPQEQLFVSLPFNKLKQRAVVGHMIKDSRFLDMCWHQVKPDWFTEEMLTRRIYEIQVAWKEKYGKAPSAEEIKGAPVVQKETVAEINKIHNQVALCLTAAEQFNLTAVKKELSEWLKSVIFSKSIMQATNAFNKKDFQSVHMILTDVVKESNEVQFDGLGEVSFEEPLEDFKQTQKSRDGALTTGLKVLDQALLTDATCGGMQRGDTTILMASVNSGKSTAMITIAAHNLKEGKDVLYMTHEGFPGDLKNKIWSCMIQKPIHELVDMYGDPLVVKSDEDMGKLMVARNYLRTGLTYIPYNKPGMAVEDVEPIIRRAQEERQAVVGKGYDLLVVDYPAKLTTHRASKGNLPRREIDRIVYDYYVQLALEYGFHSLLAIQTNREGSRINNGKEERLLTMEDVSESWGAMELASNVITINRSPMAKSNNRLTFFVAKSRSSETGTAIVCNTNFANSTTHSEELGATWYHDSCTMEDTIDDLLKQYKGQKIPDERIIY